MWMKATAVADVEQIDVPAVAGDGRVDLVIEELLNVARKVVEPERIRVLHGESAAGAVGVDGDAVEVGRRRKRHREAHSRGSVDNQLAVALVAGVDQREVVGESTALPSGDGDSHARFRLFAVGPHLLDAGQSEVGDCDSRFLHALVHGTSVRIARVG